MTICALQNVQFYISFDVLRPPIDKRGISVPLCSWSNAAAKSATEASQCASRRMSYATQSARLVAATRFALSREAGTASGGAHGIEAKIEVRAKARSVAQCCVRSAADRLRERSIARGNAERSRGSLFDKCRARRRGRRQLLGAGILRQSRRRAAAGRLFNYVDLLSHHCLRQRRRRPGARARNPQHPGWNRRR